jgi:hypothetical protein
LRAQREHDQQHDHQAAVLLCAVTAQLQSGWSALSRGSSSGKCREPSMDSLESLLEDLRDYTGAWAGVLTLESEPVHLGTLVRQMVAQACASRGRSLMQVNVSISRHVPERVRTDVRCLSKVLLQFLGMALDHSGGGELSVSVYRDGRQEFQPAVVGTGIVFAVNGTSLVGGRRVSGPQSASIALRTALAERLRNLMDATLREDATETGSNAWFLTMPLEPSTDPARASELERVSEVPDGKPGGQSEVQPIRISAAMSEDPTEGAVDFLYLDRQLGSLAQPVLARTAPAFLELINDRLTALVVAYEMADLERIRDLAQSWKASAMSVGGRKFAELLGAVEKQAAAGHVPGEGTMLPIWDALKRLEIALRRICATAANSK